MLPLKNKRKGCNGQSRSTMPQISWLCTEEMMMWRPSKNRRFFSSKHTRYIKNVKVIKFEANIAQPAKIDLNKKSFPKKKTIQNFTIDAQGLRKTKNENPPHGK